MIIDSHAHAAGAYSDVESLLRMVEKHKLEKIILCTSPKNIQDLKKPPNFPVKKSPDGVFMLNRMLRFAYKYFMKENGDGNKFVFELKNKLPELIIQFLWVNPSSNDINRLQRDICTYQPKGIKLHQAWEYFNIGSADFNIVVDIARSYKLPIFIHLYSKKDAFKLLQFIKNNKDVTFIIAHMLGLEVFETGIGFLKNLYFDTSGSERIRKTDIERAINLFGYDKVIFGTDTPYADIKDQIDKIDSLKLPDSMKEHIFRLSIKNILTVDA